MHFTIPSLLIITSVFFFPTAAMPWPAHPDDPYYEMQLLEVPPELPIPFEIYGPSRLPLGTRIAKSTTEPPRWKLTVVTYSTPSVSIVETLAGKWLPPGTTFVKTRERAESQESVWMNLECWNEHGHIGNRKHSLVCWHFTLPTQSSEPGSSPPGQHRAESRAVENQGENTSEKVEDLLGQKRHLEQELYESLQRKAKARARISRQPRGYKPTAAKFAKLSKPPQFLQ